MSDGFFCAEGDGGRLILSFLPPPHFPFHLGNSSHPPPPFPPPFLSSFHRSRGKKEERKTSFRVTNPSGRLFLSSLLFSLFLACTPASRVLHRTYAEQVLDSTLTSYCTFLIFSPTLLNCSGFPVFVNCHFGHFIANDIRVKMYHMCAWIGSTAFAFACPRFSFSSSSAFHTQTHKGFPSNCL